MLKCVIFQDSFVGKEFVDWAVDKKRISREKAIFMGKQLVSRKFGTSADNDQDFRVSTTVFYRVFFPLGRKVWKMTLWNVPSACMGSR